MEDWEYIEGCGCVVTFFGRSKYRSYRLIPYPECQEHSGRDKTAERDCLMERARSGRDAAFSPDQDEYYDMPCESCGQLIRKVKP